MAMARPTTTAMISRTTRSPSESISWTVVTSAATAGARAGAGDGERHLSAPPLIFSEVCRHHPGHVAAGPQPGEGGVIMVCGGHPAVARLARTRQVDEVAQAQAGIGPAQPDLARAPAGAHRGYGGYVRAAVPQAPRGEPLRRVPPRDPRIVGWPAPHRTDLYRTDLGGGTELGQRHRDEPWQRHRVGVGGHRLAAGVDPHGVDVVADHQRAAGGEVRFGPRLVHDPEIVRIVH